MNSSKCFVPICENTTGIPFPKQEDLCAKWLEALKVHDVAPTPESFVCLEHFLDSDFAEGAPEADLANTLKPEAVPSLKLFSVYINSSKSPPKTNEIKLKSEETETSLDVKYEEDEDITEPSISEDGVQSHESSQNEITDLSESANLPENTDNTKQDIAEHIEEPIALTPINQNEQTIHSVQVQDECMYTANQEVLQNSATNIEYKPEIHQADEDVGIQTIPDENVDKQTIQDADVGIHTIQYENVGIQTMQYENVGIQTIQDENIGITTIQDENVDNQSIQGENLSIQTIDEEDNESEQCQQSQQANLTDCTQSLRVKEKEINITESSSGNVCRLCMGNDDEGMLLSDIFEDDLLIKTVITECLYPLQVSEDDNLPQNVCASCLRTLKICHDFRLSCFETDRQLAKKTGNQRDKRKHDSVYLPSNKKSRTESATAMEMESKSLDHPGINIFGAEVVQVVEDHSQDSLPQTIPIVESPPPLVPIKHTLSNVKRKVAASPYEFNAKYKKVEEELRRVLEGSLSQDMMTADNIIIEVQSDDEEPTHSRSVQEAAKLVTRLKLPLKLKDNTVKKKPVIPINKIALPRGIRVSKFQSEIGTFPCQVVKGLYDSEFCQGDGYLFEFRLCKGSTRSLRCVVASCPAIGRQKLLPTGFYENKITVTTSHNHEAPSKGEQKKQMFYYVMKRKMQNERTLNFRTVYEDVCKRDPEIRALVPLRNVINEICRHQLTHKLPLIKSFNEFHSLIEEDTFQKLHFTLNGKQFYQERFATEDGTKAVVFANQDTIYNMSHSKIMYVDASFKIDTQEVFAYQLVTVLVWFEDSYYPIAYALVNKRSQEIFRKIFQYLHDTLAPSLRPEEIITDYEANLYYALGETYLGSHIGGSCFYYTQNLYKKICGLNLSRELETNSFFRNIYHMLLMLPLLPVNTILDGLNNIEAQARQIDLGDLTKPLFDHVRTQWIKKVTPELFCVHRLENRINENVIAPFKKLRDFLMLSKGKLQRQPSTIVTIVEKVIELEAFLRATYGNNNKKSFARDLSSSQKKNVIRAWLYIENHPKININNFFTKVLGYIKCMENQLWIWGFYRHKGDVGDDLINAINFSIVSTAEDHTGSGSGVTGGGLDDDADHADDRVETHYVYEEEDGVEGASSGDVVMEREEEEDDDEVGEEGNTVVMEAVIDEDGGFVLTESGRRLRVREPADPAETAEVEAQGGGGTSQYESAYLKYVYREES